MSLLGATAPPGNKVIRFCPDIYVRLSGCKLMRTLRSLAKVTMASLRPQFRRAPSAPADDGLSGEALWDLKEKIMLKVRALQEADRRKMTVATREAMRRCADAFEELSPSRLFAATFP
ncbi:MAG: hypothetical protein ACHRHE_01790 [Tepidisphaerales bacterium]